MVRFRKVTRNIGGKKRTVRIPIRTRKEVKKLRNPSEKAFNDAAKKKSGGGSSSKQTVQDIKIKEPTKSTTVTSSKTDPKTGLTTKTIEQRLTVGKPSEGSTASEVIKSGGSIKFSTRMGGSPQASKVTLGKKSSRVEREEREVEVRPDNFNGVSGIRTEEGITLASTRTDRQTGVSETFLAGRNINEFPLKTKQEVFSLRKLPSASGVVEERRTPSVTRNRTFDRGLQRVGNVGFNLFTKTKARTLQLFSTQKKDVKDLLSFTPKSVKQVGKDTLGLTKTVFVDPFVIGKDILFKAGKPETITKALDLVETNTVFGDKKAKLFKEGKTRTFLTEKGITPESIGSALGALSRKQKARASTITGDKSFGLSIEDRSQVLEGATTKFLAFPRDKPLQTAGLFALPGAVQAGTNVGKIFAGKKLLSLAKAGTVSPGGVRTAIGAAEIVGTTGEVAFGVGITKIKLDQFRATEGARAKGELLGETAFELGAVGAGAITTRGGGRLGEIVEAKVENPLRVAGSPSFASRANIEFAEDIGTIGLELSTSRAEAIIPKRKPSFSSIEGATSKDIVKLNTFFGGRKDRFVKGSLAQSSKLDQDLFVAFIEAKGGKISDLDLGSRGSVEPKVSFKTDVKEFSESRKIVGARDLDTFKGIQEQSFSEQSFRKASGGFDVAEGEFLDPQFGRLKKDPRDLLFNVLQAEREGIKVTPSAKRSLQDALTGKSDVTLPVKQEPKVASIIENVLGKKKVKTKKKDDILNFNVFKQTKTSKSKRSKSSSSKINSVLRSSSPSLSLLKSPSRSKSPSKSPSPSPSLFKSPSPSPSLLKSLSPSPSPSRSPSFSPSFSPSISTIPPPSLSPSPSLTPPTIPRTGMIPLFGLKRKQHKKTKASKKLSRVLRYNPSLVAVEYNIKGQRPKKLTGLEIRKL